VRWYDLGNPERAEVRLPCGLRPLRAACAAPSPSATLTTKCGPCASVAVNSRLLSENGGPCQCSEATRADFACRFYDKQYNQCVEDYRRELITTTAVSAFVGCTLMGTMANLPFALAPGMGLNAYFTYDVVGFRGTGCIPWKTAMVGVCVCLRFVLVRERFESVAARVAPLFRVLVHKRFGSVMHLPASCPPGCGLH